MPSAVPARSNRSPSIIARMFRRLAAEQCHVVVGAGVGDRFDEHLDPIDVQVADGDVVLHGEWHGPGRRQVVGHHREQVVPETVDQPGYTGDLRLGADARGRHHQYRLVVPRWNSQARRKPAEAGEHVVGPRRGDSPTDSIGEFCCCVEFDVGSVSSSSVWSEGYLRREHRLGAPQKFLSPTRGWLMVS